LYRYNLDFRDRVIKMSLGFGYLVVVTATQVCVYKETNWATPHMFDIKEVVTLVVQCRTCFLLVHSGGAVQAERC
jgi:intraflagellar transport protein 80